MSYTENLRKKVGSEPLLLVQTAVVVLDRRIGILFYKREDGKWQLPGGFMEPEETVEQAGRRKVKEIANFEVREISLLGIFSGKEYFQELENGDQVYPLTINFLTIDFKRIERQDDEKETANAKFFPLDKLPDNISETSRKVIDHYGASFF